MRNLSWKDWLLVAVLSVAIVYVATDLASRFGPAERGDAFSPPVAPAAAEEKRWIEVSRTRSVSTVVDLKGFYGWLSSTPAVANAKLVLIPECVASEPERVEFALLDPENFARLQAGYPPRAIVARPIGATGEIEPPLGQPYWMGFIEVPAKPTPAQPIPGSTVGALVYLASAFERANRPAIRLSVDIYSSVRIFSTPSEARKTILQLADGQVGR